MKFLIAFLLSFALFGCTQTKPLVCDLSKSVSSLVAAQISTQLTCKNLDAVKASVDAQLVKLKLCDQPAPAIIAAKGAMATKSVIGDTICGPVIEGLLAGVLSTLPTEWACSGGPVTDSVKVQLLAACQKAL